MGTSQQPAQTPQPPAPAPDRPPSGARPSGDPGVPIPAGSGAVAPEATTVEALAAALDRLVLSRTINTEQARAVLRELTLHAPAPGPPPPDRPAPTAPESAGGGFPGPAGTTPPGTASPGTGAPSVAAPGTAARTGGRPDGSVPGGLPGLPGAPFAGAPGAGENAAEHRSWVAVLGEVGGYVGAAFVLAGALALAGPNWHTLDLAVRLLLLAGPALVLLLVAVLIARTAPGGWPVRPRPGTFARRRLISTLAALAAGLAGGAMSQAVGAPNPNQALAALATTTAVCLLAYAACRSTVLHLALGLSLVVTAVEALDRVTGHGDDAPWAIVLVGVLWLALVETGVVGERTLGEVFGLAAVYAGGEGMTMTSDGPGGYLIIGVVALAGLSGYLLTRRIPVLVVGVISVATLVPQTVTHYAGDSLQVGGALLVTGLSIVGASVLGLVLHQRPPSHQAEPPSPSPDPQVPAAPAPRT